jgi:uncharacterized protein
MSTPKVAVITGGHPFEVVPFHALFRALPEADCYIQNMEEFATSSPQERAAYDVVLFYNMHTQTPTEGVPLGRSMQSALERLGETRQGVFVLHHALLAFPQWPLWSEIVGIAGRGFGYYHDQEMHLEVANAAHPITRGLTAWDMVDETYTMDGAGAGSEILLTVQHPRSMKTIAWTRTYRQARVFCLELGHDHLAYAHPVFRTLVGRGIQWCASRL